MKDIIAYAIIRNTKHESLGVFDGRLPIYWKKRVAESDCQKGYKVVKVLVIDSKDGAP